MARNEFESIKTEPAVRGRDFITHNVLPTNEFQNHTLESILESNEHSVSYIAQHYIDKVDALVKSAGSTDPKERRAIAQAMHRAAERLIN